ncbi:ATP-dependent DNA helicase Hrp3 [Dispira parvispora]|uniref:ATP-dependent DNA helicase Hrp3 n=1 Tax=Dispira parvispora TaxID=1520584 RepID=A0A9W8E4X7_9FUNG|nr:ATP-dependent DNA helicase Hrp3 [Dispira parvispora]
MDPHGTGPYRGQPNHPHAPPPTADPPPGGFPIQPNGYQPWPPNVRPPPQPVPWNYHQPSYPPVNNMVPGHTYPTNHALPIQPSGNTQWTQPPAPVLPNYGAVGTGASLGRPTPSAGMVPQPVAAPARAPVPTVAQESVINGQPPAQQRLSQNSHISEPAPSSDESESHSNRSASPPIRTAQSNRAPARPVHRNAISDDESEFSDSASASSAADDSMDASYSDFATSESSSEAMSPSESDSDFEFRPGRTQRKPRKRTTQKGRGGASRAGASSRALYVARRKPARRGQQGMSDSDLSSDTSDWGPSKPRARREPSADELSDLGIVRSSSRRGATAVKSYNENDMYEWDSGADNQGDARSKHSSGVRDPTLDNADYSTDGDHGLGSASLEPVAKLQQLIGEPDPDAEPNIEALRDYRLRPGVVDHQANGPVPLDVNSDSEDANAFDPTRYEYRVKWQYWSHLYDTWETLDFLSQCRGAKKFSNYVKNVVEADYYFRTDPATTPEDIEQRNIQQELERESLAQHVVLERIVACRPARYSPQERMEMLPGSRPRRLANAELASQTEETPYEETDDGPTHLEYLCRWSGLPHKDCTWETEADIVAMDNQSAIDDYYDRIQRSTVPHRGEHYHSRQKPRPRFHQLTQQPKYLVGGELRDYQLTAINWMGSLWSRNENGILADEMGLGKTIQTISFISYLFHSLHVYGPCLVVVPLSTIMAWEREFQKWAPDINTIAYIGDNRSRQAIRQFEFYVPDQGQDGRPVYPDSRYAPTLAQELADVRQHQPKLLFNVLLTTYELVIKDQAVLGDIRWAFMAVDEAHRLKNSQSLLSETLRSFQITNSLLVTGTPLQNSVKELYSLCNFLMPDKFSDREHAYFDFQVGDADPDKIRELHQRLRPYMLRRLKKEVEKSMPQKIERILRVELAPLQVHYYRNILTRNYQALNRGASGTSQMSLLNIVMELKKASNHPFLFPNAETLASGREEQLRGLIHNSGKMVLLDKLLTRLKAGGHRVLIFSQMVRLLDILSDYLALRGYAHQRLDGSVGSEARKKAIDQFNAPQSQDFVFLLSTRAGGLGINLTAADTVIIFDSDWNPQNDLQAMARAHRIGQTKTVNVYRLISKGTIEEDVIERAKRKMVLEYCIIKRMDTSGQSVLQSGTKSQSTLAVLKELAGDKAEQLAQLVPSNKANANQYFNRDELSAILKFGASNMFKESDNQKKLDDLDLDDILDRAEPHDTTSGPAGDEEGEDFLNQFQVADYGPGQDEMLEWDTIIPEDDRKRLDEEAERERLQQEEELYWSSRRRRKVVSYAEDGPGSGRHESETRGAPNGGGESSRRDLQGYSTDPQVLTDKELRALYRALLKFGDLHTRYDAIVEESDLGHKDRELLETTVQELMEVCREAVANETKSKTDTGAAPDEGERDIDSDSGDKRTAGKLTNTIRFRNLTGINASLLLQRNEELRVLAEHLGALTQLTRFRLHVPPKPVHNWACSWGQKDDAMLLVGVYKHGFGHWERIRDDPSLGFADKFFLGSQAGTPASATAPPGKSRTKASKSRASKIIDAPKSAHLNRRAEYLLKAFTAQKLAQQRKKSASSRSKTGTSAGTKRARASETSRSGRTSQGSNSKRARATPTSSQSSRTSKRRTKREAAHVKIRHQAPAKGDLTSEDDLSSVPSNFDDTEGEDDDPIENGEDGEDDTASRKRSGSRLRQTTTRRNTSRRTLAKPKAQSPPMEEDGYTYYDSMDDAECKDAMRPVKQELKTIRKDDSNLPASEKAQLIRDCVKAVGDHITKVVAQHHPETTRHRGKVRDVMQHRWGRHLWAFTTYFWPRPVLPEKLQSIYHKMLDHD